MDIAVLRKVLEKNDRAAEQNRALLDGRGVCCVNMLGGAGSGKTTVLEMALPALAGRLSCAVLEGDLQTTRDAERIAALGVPVIQLLTEGSCHLTAVHVQHALRRLDLEHLDLLIIENVGNPICPANFDLGEHARVSVLSVAEGDDKPSKYPLLFRGVELVLITKCDLLPYTNFDMNAARAAIQTLNPKAQILCTNLKQPRCADAVVDWLSGAGQRCRPRWQYA